MDELRRKLMLEESASRLRAAERLCSVDDSSSAYLLRLLGFELLLKLVYEQISGNPAPRHHKYEEIFCALDQETQDSLLQLAGERIGPSGLTEDAVRVIKELGLNFIELRYPYEKYARMSSEEYAQLGSDWIASGAKLEDAIFRFHPEELLGLTYAAQTLAGEVSYCYG